jgi:hypothetical protein
MKATSPADKNKANISTIQALRASCIASKVSNEIAARAFPASENTIIRNYFFIRE